MDFLGVGSIGAALKGAANVVREIRRPSLKSEDFATVLKARLEHPKQSQSPQDLLLAQARKASVQGQRFLDRRDANLDGMLTQEETAFEKEMFTRLDVNADGKLSIEELRAGYLAGYSGKGPALPVQEPPNA